MIKKTISIFDNLEEIKKHYKESIGSYCREQRGNARKLADHLGLDECYISNVYSQKKLKVSLEKYIKIARAIHEIKTSKTQ